MTTLCQGAVIVVEGASHTLLGLLAERFVQVVGHRVEDIGGDIVLGFGVLKPDGNVPVSQGKAGNTAVGARTMPQSVYVDQMSLVESRLGRCGDLIWDVWL